MWGEEVPYPCTPFIDSALASRPKENEAGIVGEENRWSKKLKKQVRANHASGQLGGN